MKGEVGEQLGLAGGEVRVESGDVDLAEHVHFDVEARLHERSVVARVRRDWRIEDDERGFVGDDCGLCVGGGLGRFVEEFVKGGGVGRGECVGDDVESEGRQGGCGRRGGV